MRKRVRFFPCRNEISPRDPAGPAGPEPSRTPNARGWPSPGLTRARLARRIVPPPFFSLPGGVGLLPASRRGYSDVKDHPTAPPTNFRDASSMKRDPGALRIFAVGAWASLTGRRDAGLGRCPAAKASVILRCRNARLSRRRRADWANVEPGEYSRAESCESQFCARFGGHLPGGRRLMGRRPARARRAPARATRRVAAADGSVPAGRWFVSA